MKKFLLALTILFLSISTINSQTVKRYSFKSGKIEYKYEGNTKGKAVLYWDDYGNKELSINETETTMFGFTQKSNQYKLTLNEFIYTWEKDKKKGSKTENSFFNATKENPNVDWEKLAEETLESAGYKKSGTETILGKTCVIWKGIGSISVWKFLPLKTEVNILGTKVLQVASKIETDISIPSSTFNIPKGVKFQDVDELIDSATDDENEKENAKELMKKMKSLFNKD